MKVLYHCTGSIPAVFKTLSLTVNPGKPDGPGEGIRAYIDENGYTQGNLLGYAFRDPAKAMNYLYNDEEFKNSMDM